jgi:O-methyltransferase
MPLRHFLPIRRRLSGKLQQLRAECDALRTDLTTAQQQRDAALSHGRGLQAHLDALEQTLAELEHRLAPYPECRQALAGWDLPGGASIAAAPQRYAENYAKYAASGGEYDPSDVEGFLRDMPVHTFDMPRFYMFCLVMDLIKKQGIVGNFLELGVSRGNSATLLARWARRLDRQLYLLDTFEGFSPDDLVGVDQHVSVQFADASIEGVRAHVTGGNVHFAKGYFPETVDQLPADARYALVHLDCDLYRPFAAALPYFWPRLSEGGFLVMHDYLSLHWDGTEQAVDEFFSGQRESVVPIPDMAGTVIVRKNKSA